MNLSKSSINELRDLLVSLGGDRKKMYGTSKTSLIIQIHAKQHDAESRSQKVANDCK